MSIGSIQSIGLAGLDAAEKRLQTSARLTAQAASPVVPVETAAASPERSDYPEVNPPSLGSSDLIGSTVGRMLASAAFKANLKVVQAADEMNDTIMNTFSART